MKERDLAALVASWNFQNTHSAQAKCKWKWPKWTIACYTKTRIKSRIRIQTQAFQQGLWASQAVCQPLCQMFAPKAGFRNRVSRGISFYNSVLRAFLTSESKKASKGQILTSLLYSLDQSSPTKTLYWCWGPSAIMLTLDSELQLPESTKSVEKANHNLTGKPGVIFLSF